MSDLQILDTYRAYKTREKKFTNWLRETASKIGIDETTRKPFDKDVKETLKISDIPHIVKSIVKSGAEVPESLAVTLRDVICQRKEASHFYKGRGDRVSDDGHLHYVTVLQGALQTLEHSKSAKSWSKSGSRNKSTTTSSSTTDVSFGNVFDVLPIEDVQNVAHEAPESEDNASDLESGKDNRKTTKKGRGKKKPGKNKVKGKKPVKTTENAITERPKTPIMIETGLSNDLDDEEYDLYFMIYCFFKDFNTMREYIQERWCDYQEGLLSLSTVAVITNTAFELLQRGERELLEMLPRGHPMRDFQNMANMLFSENGLAHIDYDEKEAEFEGDEEGLANSIGEEADWVCLDRCWDLTEWLDNSPPKKVVFDPESVDSIIDYGSGKGKDKLAGDRKVLMHILAEATILKSKKRSNPTVNTIPGEDEFTNGMVEFHATRKIHTWFVFACQIYCDIRYILETNARNCHGELLAAGTRSKGILSNYAEFQKDFEYQPERNLKITLLELDCWVFRDFFAYEKDMIREIHNYTGPMEEHSFMRRNPVLCGLMTFRFALTINELGIKYANLTGAITAAGHLYSAMQHTSPNLPRWHDFDTLLEIHTAPYFFWDDIPPSTPSGFASSYEKASSISKQIADRQKRESSRIGSKTNMSSTPGAYIHIDHGNEFGIGIASKVSVLYHKRFCFEHPTPIRNLPLVEQILSDTATTEITQTLAAVQKILQDVDALPKTPFTTTSSAREISTKDLTSQFEHHQMLTETQLLSVLCTRLQQETYMLNFDYFTFHIRCMRFLKAVYEEFKVEITEEDGELIEGRRELNLVVHRIFAWLMDGEKAGDVEERLRGVLERFVEREGRAEIDSLKEYMDGLTLANERNLNG